MRNVYSPVNSNLCAKDARNWIFAQRTNMIYQTKALQVVRAFFA